MWDISEWPSNLICISGVLNVASYRFSDVIVLSTWTSAAIGPEWAMSTHAHSCTSLYLDTEAIPLALNQTVTL